MESALMGNYGTPELEFDYGQGCYLFTYDGDRYLDFVMGIAVNSLGHCHPRLLQALSQQAGKLWHTSNLYRITQSEKLARVLVQHTFADRAFFCNSGTEAIECGFKMIRRFHHLKGDTKRKRIIAMSNSFHGRTLAPLAASANPDHCDGVLLNDNGFDQAEFGDLAAVKALLSEETAGIVIEPVQGEGGIRVAGRSYLQSLRDLCDEQGLLLMFDEVQCGVGRTGSLYAYQQLGVSPDILATAKGLGGGFPVGACLAVESVAAAMSAGSHGSTFGGNPLAMAVANAVIEEITAPQFLQQVKSNAAYLQAGLAALIDEYPRLLEKQTGLGLMIGVSCNIDAGQLIAQLQQQHMLAVKAGGNSIRLLPPLNVTREEIDEALIIMARVLKQWD